MSLRLSIQLSDGRTPGCFKRLDASVKLEMSPRYGYTITTQYPDLDPGIEKAWRPTAKSALNRYYLAIGTLVADGYTVRR